MTLGEIADGFGWIDVMNPTTNSPVRRLAAAAASLLLLTSACSTESTDTSSGAAAVAASDTDATVASAGDSSAAIETSSADASGRSTSATLFDSSMVHDVVVTFADGDYAEMLATFASTGDKEWIEATITIDGATYEQAGVRLKGNSSLFGLSADTTEDPSSLPWLIQLDEFVDGQHHDGVTDLVIRSNSTETAINEAVALELLEAAGLATQQAIAVSFTVNGTTELRLAIEHPDDIWEAAYFDSDDGSLYKADSEGDYSYRGDDPDAYEDVFDQKAGDDDLQPLIEFLDFINNADDATFSAELAERLDVEAFATYLAMQELVGNFDDIDGPGNNSYLHLDGETGQFTVVNWDLNLAFGTSNVNGGPGGTSGPGGRPGAGVGAVGAPQGDRPTPPEGFDAALPGAPGTGFDPTGADRPAGAPGAGGPNGGSNVLVERFLADDDFAALYDATMAELTSELFDSGLAEQLIGTWVEVLTTEATGLVTATSVESDAAAIRTWLA